MMLKQVLAKSTGETLHQHTENCLKVLSSIMDIYPEIPELCGENEFFEHLFYAIFLHDFGKADVEFQKCLQESGIRYEYRHEMLSAGFVPSINLDDKYKKAIGLAIITHHKGVKKINEFYNRIDDKGFTRDELYRNRMKDLLPNYNYLNQMFLLIPEYSKSHFGRTLTNCQRIDWHQTIDGYRYAVPWYLDDAEDGNYSSAHGLYGILLKGLLTACDHLSSASKYEIKKAIDDIKELFGFNNYTSVQLAAMRCKGNAIIISPTGSGKTEASLLWTDINQNLKKNKRIYYILPYTASINAMYKRLSSAFKEFTGDDELVGILHGKADYFIYRSLAEESNINDYKSLKEISRNIQSLTQKIFRPYKIMTPFQILKPFFGVNGFEQRFSEMVGGLFILDEIHAYNSRITALILESLKILQKKYEVKILIMSATLPRFIKEMFIQDLKIKCENLIVMDSSELDRYTRHRVQIVAGEIVDNLESILYDINSGKKVLVVCNTVSRCQEIFKALNKETESAILHGRFILRDRERIEKNLDNLKLLVGTQAIEVSLNIDYDVLYTEPAPIDALLQRFGRVNRRVHKGGVKTICPVHIFDKGSDKDSFIYSHNIVNDTLKVLKGINILKESLIQKLVDSVYKDGYTGKQLDEFISTTESFKSFYQTIIPFVNNEDVEEKFYSLFDNYTVVPIRFISEYTEEIKHGRYFEAMGYTLGISRGQFNKLNNDNRIYKEGTMYFINCEYDNRLGLLLDEYPSSFL